MPCTVRFSPYILVLIQLAGTVNKIFPLISDEAIPHFLRHSLLSYACRNRRSISDHPFKELSFQAGPKAQGSKIYPRFPQYFAGIFSSSVY